MGNMQKEKVSPTERPRFACILIPSFPLQALLRSNPSFSSKKVCVLDGDIIAFCSSSALASGIRRGMTIAQALSIAKDAVLCNCPPEVISSAQSALLDIAFSFSPLVEPIQNGTVVLDISGTQQRFPSVFGLGASIEAMCKKNLFSSVRVGIADGIKLSIVTARAFEGVSVMFKGHEASHLSKAPIESLAPSQALLAIFKKLGINKVSDLLRLNPKGIGTRLGNEALKLYLLAQGEDNTVFNPITPTTTFEEALRLDYSLEQAEPLIFLLSSVIERLFTRLDGRGFVCSKLVLSLQLEDKGCHVIPLELPRPSNDIKTILQLFKLSLDKNPPPSPVTGFSLQATPAKKTMAQAHLLGPPEPEPSSIDSLIVQIASIVGAENVGYPVCDERKYFSGAFLLAHEPSALPSLSSEASEQSQKPPVIALRKFNPPKEISVLLRDGVPVAIEQGYFKGHIRQCAGPWFMEASWWSNEHRFGAFYDVALGDGRILRLWHDLVEDKWFIEGVYD